jgi:hypothetical protein
VRAQLCACACACVRGALIAHRDIARVMAIGPFNGQHGRARVDGSIVARLDPGVEKASIAADSLMDYVTGFVFQEQAQPHPGFNYATGRPARSLPSGLRNIDITDDENFHTAIEAILIGFAHKPAEARTGRIQT